MQASHRTISYVNKELFYKELLGEISGYLETHWLINMANFAAIINQHLPQINWVGFYLNKNNTLILGPFQGLPACSQIPFGKGVCGNSALAKKSLLVEDVDQFPGHIACDSASKSELVIPILFKNHVLGVLDIDSPLMARFDSVDQTFLSQAVDMLVEKTDWSPLLSSNANTL